MIIKSYIYITTQFVAYHKWDNAPDSVFFLRQFHRHLFKVKVTWEVSHPDREKEFFIMKWKVDDLINKRYKEKYFVDESCEMIAAELAHKLKAFQVEVSEDGENGAIVIRRGEK